MNKCPFCGFDEGWTVNSPYDKLENRDKKDIHFVVMCNVCKGIGPESKTPEGAEKKWDSILSTIDPIKEKDEWLKTLNEFHKGNKPLDTLGLGELNRKDFSSIEDFVDWLISILPTILNTDIIPDDLIINKNTKHNPVLNYGINQPYWAHIMNFLQEKKLGKFWLQNWKIINIWENSVCTKIRKLQNKEINEFSKGNNPVDALGLGNTNRKDFKDSKDFAIWIVSILPTILGTEKIPDDFIINASKTNTITNPAINPIYHTLIVEFIKEKKLNYDWLDISGKIYGYYSIINILLENSEINEFSKGNNPLDTLNIGIANIKDVTFTDVNEWTDLVIKLIPHILGTKEIPENIIMSEFGIQVMIQKSGTIL